MTDDLFDLDVGRRLRDLGIDQADGAADPAWSAAALLAVHDCAKALPEFICDEVWKYIPAGFDTHEKRAMGGVIKWAVRLEWIEGTGDYRQTRRKASHATPRQIWRSLIYRGAPPVRAAAGGSA